MKRIVRQGVAVLMAVLTVLTVMPVQNLYAAEVDAVVQEEVTKAETESEEVADTYLLNYLVVESAYLVTPGTQNVVASVGDANINITEAVLYYVNKDTGEAYEKAVDKIAGDAMLFSICFDDANQAGVYELQSITYTAEGITNEVALTDLGKDTVFGVNKEVETEADAYIVDENAVEGEVVTFDENGNQTSEKSIAEAMESAVGEDNILSQTYAAGTTDKKNFVVVLDPGHGGSDPGACRTINGVNYYERDLVLKIAQFCKAELEKNGFTVYLTRNDNTSPLMDRKQRTDYAVSVGANVIVSLHINATGSDTTTASGSMVYVPNADTDSGVVSNELAETILEKLAELGLTNRGTIVDEGLGMIKYPKDEGIPGILVEHAFINNPSDVANYLSTDEQLKALGVADAKGITEYFGVQGPIYIYNGVNYAPVYDYDYYVTKYPDIKAAYGDNKQAALAHFVNYGMREGRRGSEDFDVNSYRYRYSDLRRAYGSDWKKYYIHYLTTGRFEGRAGTGTTAMQNAVTKYGGIDYAPVYDYNYYTSKYPNVKSACRDDDAAVLKYFVETGMQQGHQAKDTFNVHSYRYRYTDLRRAFGADLKKYYIHYITNGRFEGRVGTGTSSMQNPTTKYNGVDYSAIYDYNYYSAKYPDVKKACGDDDVVLLKYFVETGMKLGHRGNAAFDVNSYRYRYADLRGAYGTDLKKYYMHYMNYGRFEGRVGTGTTSMQNPTTKYKGIDYSAVYDYNYYITKNPDVKKALGDDDTVVLAHFVNYGMNEGRQAKAAFNVYVYKNNYADLQAAYGNNLKAYYLHYNNYGKNEGRDGATQIYTSIMGSSNTTAAQMAAYYKANAAYPSYYAQHDAEAKTIEDFCRIYIEECNAEGVRAEVAFSQAMLETGFLQYKGDVLIEQYNFAGIDASGKKYDEAGNIIDIDRGRSYSTVRLGIRAHVQRLKAYAVKGTNPSSFKNPCVDPDKFASNWWTSTIVGIAPHVEWLGKQENPSGFGWATAKGYGTLIKNNMARLKKY